MGEGSQAKRACKVLKLELLLAKLNLVMHPYITLSQGPDGVCTEAVTLAET